MLKIVYTLARYAARAGRDDRDRDAAGWRRDPLAHPAIAAMSLAEIADLPQAALRAACRE